jgi:hypothetical protein
MQCDIYKGCLLVRKREWTVRVQYIDPSTDSMRSADGEPNYKRTKTLKVDPYSMVADVRAAIVHSVLSMKPDPEEYLSSFYLNDCLPNKFCFVYIFSARVREACDP